MFDNVYPKFHGKPIVPTKEAAYELDRCDLSLDDVAELLGVGFDCGTSRRAAGKLEKGLQRGKSLIKAVVVEKQDRWIVIHVGKIGMPSGLKRRNKHARS